MGLTHSCKLCTCMPATTSINIQHAHVQFTLHKNFRNKANKMVLFATCLRVAKQCFSLRCCPYLLIYVSPCTQLAKPNDAVILFDFKLIQIIGYINNINSQVPIRENKNAKIQLSWQFAKISSRENFQVHGIYIRRIKRFPAKTFIDVGMVQRVIKNRVRAPTHHTGNKSPDTRRGSLASLAIHNPCRSRFIAFKRLCIHCTQVNILRLRVTFPPFTWHFESGLSHSHAQANPDSIGIRSRLNPDYRILVRRWIISGFRCEIAQSRSQAPERARKVGGKGDAYGASFPNSLKSCTGAAIIATYPNRE